MARIPPADWRQCTSQPIRSIVKLWVYGQAQLAARGALKHMSETLTAPFLATGARSPIRASTRLLLVYIFLLYSRVFEAASVFHIPNLYPMLVLSAIGLAAILFNGGLARACKTPIGILLLAFTCWAILALPFSNWRSESLSQLVNVWLKSLAAFFIITGLTRDFSDSQRTFSVIGWAAVIATLIMKMTDRIIGERLTSVGSLGNSNEAAFHIMFGMPFVFLLIHRVKPILKIPLIAMAALSVALSVKTASRAGLVMAGTLVLIALLKVSFANRVKILAVAALALLVGALTVNQVALERYKTMFGETDSSMEAQSARESAESRKYLLKEAIELTYTHPLFGVGMGVFAPAAAELSRSRGERPLWLVSHNSYVQVSSELGFPGLFLMLAIFGSCLLGILKLDRTARRLGLKDIQNMSLCLLLSFTALMIHYFFDAAAYDLYLPVAAGLCTALFSVSQPLQAEAEARLNAPESVPRTQQGTLETVAAGRAAAEPDHAVPAKLPGPNPFRFGRRRNSSRR
jgi:O-antigen ligase